MTYTNLNLPEATVKLLESKGGIKALADGDIAVENDNLEALRKVLKEAFPKDYTPIEGGARLYEKHFWTEGAWNGFTETTTPSIPASILVKELEEKPFEWGERVWVSDNGKDWFEAIYLSVSASDQLPYSALLRMRTNGVNWRHCRKEKPSPLRITPEMIKEKFGCKEFEIVNEKG